MAQEPRSPWSRWDFPNADAGVPAGSPIPRQFDYMQQNPSSTNSEAQIAPQKFMDATLITKELNPNDSSFYNCIYGVPNSLQQVIQECHVDVDCCEKTCCDSNWREKYAIAVILLSLFCVIVLISLLIWLIVWLINRARDKKQREKLAETAPYPSHMNVAMQPYATIQPQPSGTLNKRRY